MLVLDGFLLWDGVQGAFAPLLLGLAALAVVVGASARIAGGTVALLAGAIFFAQPFMLWQTTSTFVEPGLAFVLALACWNLWRFARDGDRPWCVCARGFLRGRGGRDEVHRRGGRRRAAAVAAWLLRDRLRARHALVFALPARRRGPAVVREERGADRQSRLSVSSAR